MVTKVGPTTIVSENDTYAHFRLWAGTGGVSEGLAGALSTLGFTKQSDTYTAQWANGATIGDTARSSAAGNLFGAAFPSTTTRQRAGLAGSHFKGAWVASTSYSVGDVVTDTTTAQIVFICTSATSSATAPINLVANWSPYWMEIWATTHVGTVTTVANASGGNTTYTISPIVNKGVFPVGASITFASCGNAANNGTFTVVSYDNTTGLLVVNNASGVAGSSLSGTATNALTKFYIKIEYGCTSTQANPELAIQIGNAYSANTGVINGSGNFTVVEQVINGTASAVANDMVFSGDGCNYFGTILWRANTSNDCGYFLERSISGTTANAPVYNNAYVTYISVAHSAGIAVAQCSLFLSGGTQTSIREPQGAHTVSFPTNSVVSLSVGGKVPVFPVFPMVGYVGNPMTVVVTMGGPDAVENTTITANVYGASHSYLETKTATFNGFGTGIAAAWGVGMRFE